MNTPFGKPSTCPVEGTLGGVAVVVLVRHGDHHSIPPGEINYRANNGLLRSSGLNTSLLQLPVDHPKKLSNLGCLASSTLSLTEPLKELSHSTVKMGFLVCAIYPWNLPSATAPGSWWWMSARPWAMRSRRLAMLSPFRDQDSKAGQRATCSECGGRCGQHENRA